MKINLKRELPSIIMVLLPLIYLIIVWNDLGDLVPIHWNIEGEVDRYGSKYFLLFVSFLMPFSVYITFALVERFGPKEKIAKMGRKFGSLKFILTLFMSTLALFIIHSAKTGSIKEPTLVFVLLGLMLAAIGNYFKTMQTNYFIGIRTPWTLKYESVWKSTHEMGGKMWFGGGLLIALIAAISVQFWAIISIFIVIGFITIVPIVYSYFAAKKLKNQ
ncbi:SdpI family protein [Crocinitomix sp.]|nr:SdpI family protein [Crocinitomix sp.]